MDVPRKNIARRRRIVRGVWMVVGLAAVAAITLGLSRLKPAAPSVDRATLFLGQVKRGEMLREVRGTGNLVPEIVWFIPATTAGRVEKILVLPGKTVEADTVLIELSNPQLQLEAVDAEWKLKAAEASFKSLEVRLQDEQLALEASAARVEADYNEASLLLDVNQELFDNGLISERNLRLTQVRVNELKKLNAIEMKRLALRDSSQEARLADQRARVEQARALSGLRTEQLDLLHVRAGTPGVLEQMQVQVGEQVAAGTTLAKVTDPTKLKAVLRVPETQAREVRIGQIASIDTRSAVAPGRVVRIDPAVQNGTVAVDISFDGPLPEGARPDLSVIGNIEIERMDDVLYVGRPVYGQEQATVGLFKILPDTSEAVRVKVQLGRSSVNTIEIVSGLVVGDTIVLSDMSQWDEFDRLRLK
ncbi:MAG: HlyD family efflux transporter periplasmic adaptor subunit [Planctomycetes bacterium]|nr:HlyD family efflux transporter periplasmic adaptor subunit [Planctomycetota bacterium]